MLNNSFAWHTGKPTAHHSYRCVHRTEFKEAAHITRLRPQARCSCEHWAGRSCIPSNTAGLYCFSEVPQYFFLHINNVFDLFRGVFSHNFTVLSGRRRQCTRLIKSLWHKCPAALICYPPCCIDLPSHRRVFEGCWCSIYICNTFVLIKCSHSMEIGYLTKWLEPTVIGLIAVTVASSMPHRSIFRVAGHRILNSKWSNNLVVNFSEIFFKQ